MLAAAPAALAALAIAWSLSAHRTTRTASAVPRPELLVYARAPSGAERLALQLPGAAGGYWSKQERVRFSLRHRGAAFVYLLGVGPGGAVQSYFPRPEDAPRLVGDGKLRALGQAFQVGTLHQTGPVRLLLVSADRPLSDKELAGRARSVSARSEGNELSATLDLVP